jgi:hypothetical protein
MGPDRLNPKLLRSSEPDNLRPWTSADLIRTVVCNAVGLFVVFISWDQASAQTAVRSELTWFELGLLGLSIAGIGNALWVLSGRRNVGLARVALFPGRPGPRRPRPTDPDRPDVAHTDLSEHVLVAAANMTRYHRTDCPLVQGKQVSAKTLGRHRTSGRMACELCTP